MTCVLSRLHCDADRVPERGPSPGCSLPGQLCCPRLSLSCGRGQNRGGRAGPPGCHLSESHGQRAVAREEDERGKPGQGSFSILGRPWADLMLREQPGWGWLGARGRAIGLISERWSPEEAMTLPPAGAIGLRQAPTSSGHSFLSLSKGGVKNRALHTPGTAEMKNNGILERMSPE